MRSPREPHLHFSVKAPCKQHSSVTRRLACVLGPRGIMGAVTLAQHCVSRALWFAGCL